MEKVRELTFTHQVGRLRDHFGDWQKTGSQAGKGHGAENFLRATSVKGEERRRRPETLLCWKRRSGVESRPHQRPLRKMEMRMDLFSNSTVSLGPYRGLSRVGSM